MLAFQVSFVCMIFKVLKGSHKCGRIEHSTIADQIAADYERVGELKKKLDLEYVELNPGRAVQLCLRMWNMQKG
jgi:hypothetical protein